MLFRILLLVFGGILIYMGYGEWQLAQSASATPEEISLKALLERGAEGNPNVMLTNFVMGQNIVFSSRKERWTKVWVPIVPIEDLKAEDGKAKQVESIRALLCSTNVHDAQELETRLNKPSLQGLVINKVASVGSKEADLLKSSYPQFDVERCLIIQEGRTPADAMKMLLYFGGGGALIVVSLVMFVVARRQASQGG
jgi:hypothetical protein